MRSLRACLQDEPLAFLMGVAALWDAAIGAATPQEMAAALAAHMLHPSTLRAVLGSLPEAARNALEALIAAGGKMPLATFERRFGAMRVMGPRRFEREQPWRAPQNPAEVLRYHGLVFRAFDRIAGEVAEVVFVPEDLLARLQPSAPGESARAEPLRGSVNEQRSAIAPLLDDLTTLLCHVQNATVRPSADGTWDAASRRAVLPMLRDADGALDGNPNGRFAFLTHLLRRLGWVRVVNQRLRLVPQPVQQWLQSTPEHQREVVYRAWCEDETWNDLAHVDGLRFELTHAWSNDPLRERRAILGLWERWAPDPTEPPSWERVEAFVRFVHEHHPDFARPDGRYDTWHIREVRTGAFLSGFEHWDRIEGALIRYVLTKPMRWLREEIELPQPADEPPFVVTAAGLVYVAAERRWTRFQLARVAEWVRTEGDRYVYVLTPTSLARARAQRIAVSRVIAFLEQNAAAPLPKGVREALLRWESRAVEARLSPCALLQASEASTMDALLRLPQVRRAVIARLSPTRLLVRFGAVEDVRAAALAEGLLIEIEGSFRAVR